MIYKECTGRCLQGRAPCDCQTGKNLDYKVPLVAAAIAAILAIGLVIAAIL